MYHVIMAGGSGTRFWPLSREKTPKQFLGLIGEKSLIQNTYERLLKISPKEKIFILAPKKYKKNILEQFPNINSKNLLFEPSPRNTAPAIYFASLHISNIDSNAIIGIYPSDHHINNDANFITDVKKVNRYIENFNQSIVTLGIKPKFPSTSYGYINIDKKKKPSNGIYKVKKFLEKPNSSKAKKLIVEKDNFWNSGMFFFNAKSMINEIEIYVPKINELFSEINSLNEINKIWDSIPKNSIDYAVMEKTSNIYCLQSNMDWSDLGTWLSLYQHMKKDKEGNIFKGQVLSSKSSNNLIFSNKTTAVIGLDNIAIVNTDDATLVIDLSKSEDVKDIIDELDEKLR